MRTRISLIAVPWLSSFRSATCPQRAKACLAIGVNTTRWYRHEDGEASLAQLQWVQRHLQRVAPQQLRLMVEHQPVAVTLGSDRSNRLHGRDAAVEYWAQAGADLVLGGHIHLPFGLPLHEIFDGCTRALWAVQAGTALSTRVRAGTPNSVKFIRYCSDAVISALRRLAMGLRGRHRAV